VGREDDRLFHSPWFIDMRAEDKFSWKEINGKKWHVFGTVIYDVEGEETYMSKRALNPAPHGYMWKEFNSIGTHWVTISSLRPNHKYGVNLYDFNQGTLMALDHVIPVKDVRKVRADEHQGFLLKGTEVVRVLGPTSEQILAIPEAYETACGRLFLRPNEHSGAVYHMSPDLLHLSNLHV
jgi:hypothetical protein